MSFSEAWLPAALCAHAAFAGAVLVDKALLDRHGHDPREFASAIGLIDLGVATALIVWLGPGEATNIDRSLMLMAGGLLYLYLVPYLRALRLDDPSTVAPLFQFVPLFTLTLTWLFFGQSLNLLQGMGFVLVSAGTVMFVIGDGVVPWRIRTKTARFMAVSSFLLATELMMLDRLLERNSYGDTLPWVLLGLGAAGILSAAIRLRSGAARVRFSMAWTGWAVLGIAEGLNIAGEALLTYALVSGPVVLVALLSGSELVFLLLFGYLLALRFPSFITERIGRRGALVRVAASMLVFAGVGLVGRA